MRIVRGRKGKQERKAHDFHDALPGITLQMATIRHTTAVLQSGSEKYFRCSLLVY
jgi:hypothetical protein